jgi:hypothetical protein
MSDKPTPTSSWHSSRWYKKHPKTQPAPVKPSTIARDENKSRRSLSVDTRVALGVEILMLILERAGIDRAIIWILCGLGAGISIEAVWHSNWVEFAANRRERIKRIAVGSVLVIIVLAGPGWWVWSSSKPLDRANVALDSIRMDLQDPNMLHVVCLNDSDTLATDQLCIVQAYLVGLANKRVDNATVEERWVEFLKYLQSDFPTREPHIVEPHRFSATTISLEPQMTAAEQRSMWEYHEITLLFTGIIIWSDRAGPHRKEFCRWIDLPPEGVKPQIVRAFGVRGALCSGYNHC